MSEVKVRGKYEFMTLALAGMRETGESGKCEVGAEVIGSEKVNKMRNKGIRWILVDNQSTCGT